MVKITEVEYKVSLYPSKCAAYHSKNKNKGEVKLYLSIIWKHSKSFEHFVQWIIYYIIIERICLERGFQKIRMKNRCKPCKMEKYALEMYKWN